MAIKKLAFPVGKRRHNREGEEATQAEEDEEEASHTRRARGGRRTRFAEVTHRLTKVAVESVTFLFLSLLQIHDITIDSSMCHTPAHSSRYI